MSLSSTEIPHLYNNFKESGPLFKRIRQEFIQASFEIGRDQNTIACKNKILSLLTYLSIVTGIEFKTYILDKYYYLILSDDERQALSVTMAKEF